VDAKFFTAHSSCTEEPVFVTSLHTLLQLPFLELSPICSSLKIATRETTAFDVLRSKSKASGTRIEGI